MTRGLPAGRADGTVAARQGAPQPRRRRRHASSALVLGVALLAGLAGCPRNPTVDLGLPRQSFTPADYKRVLDRWTRHRRVIRQFDTNLDVHATYLSKEFVTAHAALYADHYHLTPGEKRRYLAKRLAEVSSHHEFFLGVTTADSAWNDFDRKDSIWRISLEDDHGTRVRPLAVRKVAIRETHRIYFPYLTRFHSAYHVIFPVRVGSKPFVTTRTRWFKLIIASPLGAAELGWYVKPRRAERTVSRRASKPASP